MIIILIMNNDTGVNIYSVSCTEQFYFCATVHLFNLQYIIKYVFPPTRLLVVTKYQIVNSFLFQILHVLPSITYIHLELYLLFSADIKYLLR